MKEGYNYKGKKHHIKQPTPLSDMMELPTASGEFTASADMIENQTLLSSPWWWVDLVPWHHQEGIRENNFREWAEGLFLLLFLHLLMSDHQETMSSGFVLRLRCSIGRRSRRGSEQSSCVISGALGNWVTFGLNFPSQVQVKVCLICTEEVSDVLENETGCTGQGQLSWVCKSHPRRRRANSCQPHQRRSL